MTEIYPSDAELNAQSGTADAEQEVLYVATGESPYYTSFYKMLYRLLDAARRAGDLRVYKDGDLTFGVRAGLFMDGDAPVEYAGAATQALTANQTNYIYLTADGTLTVNITGFPDPSETPHVPLATIVAGASSYALSDLTDYRGRAFLAVASGLASAEANKAQALLSPEAVTAAGLQDSIPNLNVTAGAEVAHVRAITIQARDAGNNSLAERMKVRLWIATSDFGAPSATDNTVALTTGTQLQQIVANADYEAISDAAGKVVFNLTVAGTVNRYVLAEIDGRIYSSGVIAFD